MNFCKKPFLLLLCLLMCPFAAQADQSAEDLFLTINKRLSYMEDVALFKALKHLPIEDIAREIIVIDKAKESASKQGLDPETIEDFFSAQISAAKAIQFRYRADLLTTPTNRVPRDLQNVVRPALITLGNEILVKLIGYLEKHKEFTDEQFPLFNKAVNSPYLNVEDKKFLFAALQKIRAVQ